MGFSGLGNSNYLNKALHNLDYILFVAVMVFVYFHQINIPISDDFSTIWFVEKYYTHDLHFVDLLRPHNDCRMLFPRLIQIPIIILTKWQYFPLAFINLCLLFVFYLRIKKRFFSGFEYTSMLTTFIIFLLIFSFKPYENLIMPFALCHFMAISFVYFAIDVDPEKSNTRLIISCIYLTIASFSYITGFIGWGLLVLFLYSKKTSLKKIVAVICTGILTIFIYFYNYPHINQTGTFKLKPFLEYSLVWFSGNYTTTAHIGIIISVVSFLIVLYVFLRNGITNTVNNNLIGLLIFLFGIVSGLLTSFGRSPMGVNQALSERYCSLSLPFCIGFLIILSKKDNWSAFQSNLLSVFLLCICIIFLMYQHKFYNRANKTFNSIHLLEKDIKNNIYNLDSIKTFIHPYPENIKTEFEVLKKYKLGIFKNNN